MRNWGLGDVDYPNFISKPDKSSRGEFSFVQGCCPLTGLSSLTRHLYLFYGIESIPSEHKVMWETKTKAWILWHNVIILLLIHSVAPPDRWDQSATSDFSACPHEADCKALFGWSDSFPESTFAINCALKIFCFFAQIFANRFQRHLGTEVNTVSSSGRTRVQIGFQIFYLHSQGEQCVAGPLKWRPGLSRH